MPTATDLVTDLPADFEVFGQAVDTRLKALQPGTTLGDIVYSSATANTSTRLPIGTTGQVLSVVAGVPAWQTGTTGDITAVTAGTGITGGGTSGDVTITNSMATAIDAKGDLVVGTGADTFSRLAVGANNTILTADSTAATGQKWSNAAALNQISINSARTTEKLVISFPGAGTDGFYFNNEEASGTSRTYINFLRASGSCGSITGTNSAVAYNTSSDYRLKENVNKIEGAIDKVNLLNPVNFNFIVDKDNPVDGFIAHEIQEIIPNVVSGAKDAIDAEGNPVYQGVDYSKLVPILTAAIQELSAKVAALEAAK
jgi:hypothetical protein